MSLEDKGLIVHGNSCNCSDPDYCRPKPLIYLSGKSLWYALTVEEANELAQKLIDEIIEINKPDEKNT